MVQLLGTQGYLWFKQFPVLPSRLFLFLPINSYILTTRLSNLNQRIRLNREITTIGERNYYM